MLVPYQHVGSMKIRYGISDYDIGDTVGGMLRVTIARKHVSEAMAVFDACKINSDVIVLSDIRRARKTVSAPQKKVASR